MDWNAIEAKIEQAAQQEAEAAQRRISERREARRKRQRRRKIAKVAGTAAALALGCAILAGAATLGSRKPAPSAPFVSPDGPDPPTSAESGYIAPTATEAVTLTPGPTGETAQIAPEAPAKLLESVPLDAETQAAIFDLCGQDPELFCAAMAIAWKESRFDTEAVGDGGKSIGMMQINTRWNTERMEALGVTDLTDPIQCVTVALDVLRELSEDYGLGWVHDHSLYMAYNMGPGNARSALDRGAESSEYSREALAAFEGYLDEMEAKE